MPGLVQGKQGVIREVPGGRAGGAYVMGDGASPHFMDKHALCILWPIAWTSKYVDLPDGLLGMSLSECQ